MERAIDSPVKALSRGGRLKSESGLFSTASVLNGAVRHRPRGVLRAAQGDGTIRQVLPSAWRFRPIPTRTGGQMVKPSSRPLPRTAISYVVPGSGGRPKFESIRNWGRSTVSILVSAQRAKVASSGAAIRLSRIETVISPSTSVSCVSMLPRIVWSAGRSSDSLTSWAVNRSASTSRRTRSRPRSFSLRTS